jgi:hypothetical protein
MTVRHSYQNAYGDMNTYIAIISGKGVELVPAVEINDCALFMVLFLYQTNAIISTIIRV